MKISTRTQYGLRAMAYLAQKNESCSVKEISVEEGIPYNFLEKILAKLKDAHLLKVKRGAHGGYSLSINPEKISAGQIIKVFEGTFAPVLCVAKEKSIKVICPRSDKCLTKTIWHTIQENLISTLDSITLASLINKK